jgi:hypothetical protein
MPGGRISFDKCSVYVSISAMLIVSGTSREENRQDLASGLCKSRVPIRLRIHRSRLVLDSVPWREYWQPCRAFLEADLRLVQRLNRLKRAWQDILRHPADRLYQMQYCWRYFGLLHHALRIARDEPRRPDPLSSLGRIVGFESFPIEAIGEPGFAACTATSRNPVFLLGQLAVDPTVPTPRHVPLLMPAGRSKAFYYYRQVLVSGAPAQRMLVSPAVNLPERARSFTPIDRLTRLISERSDPYWKPRAKLLTRRVLAPLLQARGMSSGTTGAPLSILDLGAGTGHLVAKAWTYLQRMSQGSLPPATFHFVDSNAPAFGRSFGLTRDRTGVAHIEWTTDDYRALVDNDQWLDRCGPFDWVFACRILDNASNFLIESVDGEWDCAPTVECLPHRCLAPRCQPAGIHRLLVSPVRRQANGGTALPGTAGVFCTRDGFSTEARHYVITSPEWAEYLRGERLW